MPQAFVVPTIFTAVDKMSAVVNKMSVGVQGFAKKAETGLARMERGFRKFTPGLGEAQRQMLNMVGAAAIFTAISAAIIFSANSVIKYEKTLASLSAITGVSGKDFDAFKNKIKEVAKSTKSSSIDVAKGFEIIGSAKPELLKNADALGAVTQAAITLSKATGQDLAISAQSLTGTLNQFNLGAKESQRVINALAAGSKEGAAAVPLITESLDKFGTIAASLNLTVEDSIGLIETLAEKNIKGAEAGTKLRNVLTKMATAESLPKEALKQLAKFGVNASIVADKTLPLNERLKELSKIQNDATALAKVFGTENLVAGQVLLQNVSKVQAYTDAVTGTNIAQEQADKNMNTFSGRLTELKAKWTTMITTAESSTAGLGVFKNILVSVTENLETIVTVIASVVGAYVAWFLIMKVIRIALFAYNVVLGISSALSGTAAIAVGANSIALGAYTFVTGLATAATTAFTVILAILTSPITLIILGIALLIAGIVLLVRNWDVVSAAISRFIDKFPLLRAVIDFVVRSWDMLKRAFSAGGFTTALKAIGASILSFLLAPIEKVLAIMALITRSDTLANAAKGIQSFRQGLIAGVEAEITEKEAEKVLLNPEAKRQEGITERIERTEKTSKTELLIKDLTGRAELSEDSGGGVPIMLQQTGGF